MELSNNLSPRGLRSLFNRAARSVWLSRVFAAPVLIWQGIARQYRMARDIAHLENMGDRELRDIGVDRWQIVEYVRGGAPIRDDLDYRRTDHSEGFRPTFQWRNIAILASLVVPSILWADRSVNFLRDSLSGSLADSAAIVSVALAIIAVLLILAMGIGDQSTRYARLRPRATLVLASMLTSLAAAELFKHVIGRARPVSSGGDPWWFSPLAFDDRFASLPSAQASCAAAIVLSLAIPLPRLKGVLVLLGATVCLMRVLLGAHWLSDVIAGWTLGAATVAVLSRVTQSTA